MTVEIAILSDGLDNQTSVFQPTRTKPITLCTCDFSNTLSIKLQVIARNSHWLVTLFWSVSQSNNCFGIMVLQDFFENWSYNLLK